MDEADAWTCENCGWNKSDVSTESPIVVCDKCGWRNGEVSDPAWGCIGMAIQGCGHYMLGAILFMALIVVALITR